MDSPAIILFARVCVRAPEKEPVYAYRVATRQSAHKYSVACRRFPPRYPETMLLLGVFVVEGEMTVLGIIYYSPLGEGINR
jgi:hypothetical protein